MMTERRKATAEYRERVHGAAEYVLSWAQSDYDLAVSMASELAALDNAEQLDADVLSLLTRRAQTVAGIRQPEALVSTPTEEGETNE